MSVLWMYLKVFLVGGALCAVGELLVLRTRLTPARILVCYIIAGCCSAPSGCTARWRILPVRVQPYPLRALDMPCVRA